MRYFCVLITHLSLICLGACELSLETREKYVNEFLEYLNNLPNQQYVFEEGALVKYDTVAEKTYRIEANFKVSELHNVDSVKFLLCTATLLDLDENGISIQDNEYQCSEPAPEGTAPTAADDIVTESFTTEDVVERRPLQLDNEIQPGNTITSGEQFIAVPREEPAPCIGCSTRVDPQAGGVNDLAALAMRHLDRHEPTVRHTLISVVDVERQVQVVNGVRYILTLSVDYNNCTETEIEGCNFEKPCKITVLEKPWVKLRDGSKYRAILANNCTADWLFGDNGEVMPQNNEFNNENNEIDANPFSNNNHGDEPKDKPTPDYDKIANTGSVDDILKVVHKSDLQAQQREKNALTDEQMRNLQEQIIPLDKFKQYSLNNDDALYKKIPQTEGKENFGNIEREKHVSDSALPVRHPVEKDDTPSAIPEDKKKAIDELLNFFSFSGMDTKIEDSDTVRIKRSYDPDLKTMNLVDRFQKLKRKLQNAKYLVTLGQCMVDYLNEMDMEVKSRVLNDVTAAQEESDNNRQFVYLQARVSIPCEKAVCDKKVSEIELCNAIMDTTKRVSPQVLEAFCVAEEDKKPSLSYPGKVNPDDPVLHKLAELAVKKIESESPYPNAFKIRQILSGVTQKLSGTLTMISLVLEFIDCNKTVPHVFRSNCSTIDSIGTKVCEIQIHQRPEFREKSITYTCTDRPADESFSSIKYSVKQGDVNDPKVIEVAHEALQYLEVQSNNNNKPKIVEVRSVSSKLVAGMLTNVEFVVGYTTCANDVDMVDVNSCSLIENEPLRLCEAQVWDRPWLEDGKQMKVSCKILTDKNVEDNNKTVNLRQKRSSKELNFVGGKTSKDTNDKKFIQLAKESLQKHIADSAINEELKVVNLKKVTVQVVAGSLTRIEFEITPSSNCVLNTETTLCDAMKSEGITTCSAEIWERPWLNKKEIKINCQQRSVPGGETRKDSNDPKYKALAEESLLKYLQSSGNKQEHKVIRVDDVLVQTVAGKLTKIDFTMSPQNCKNCEAQMYKCHSEVWERPWLNSKEITVSCKKVENNSMRKKRDADEEYGPGGGGIIEVDPTLSIYQTLARKSLLKHMETSEITEPHKVVDVKKVTFQIVSGTMTRIDFVVAPGDSECKPDKAPSDPSDECEKCGECKIYTFDCHSEVWEQAWLNKTEITVNCSKPENNLRPKKHSVGGRTDKDPSDPKYKTLAAEALEKHLQASGNTDPHKIIQVKKVTVQVVAGTLTNIRFTVSRLNMKYVFDCDSKVWEQPWINKKEITIKCHDDEKSRKKRALFTGETINDLNDPNFKKETQNDKVKFKKSNELTGIPKEQDVTQLHRVLAEESLKKYQLLQNSRNLHKVVEVKKVIGQKVSGNKYVLDFTAAQTLCSINALDGTSCEPSDILLYCHSEIWDRPWLKRKDIDVVCSKDANYSNEIAIKNYQDLVPKNKVNNKEQNLDPMPRSKRDLGDEIKVASRDKRQLPTEDDMVDDEIKYYYAQMILDDMNSNTHSQNIEKLITIHDIERSMHMRTPVVRMYIETAKTFCLRDSGNSDPALCDEIEQIDHRICLARIYPSPDDELVVLQKSVVCDDDYNNFVKVTGIDILQFVQASLDHLEESPNVINKLYPVGAPHIIPSLRTLHPMKLQFVVGEMNCPKTADLVKDEFCITDATKGAKMCTSFIWLKANSKAIRAVRAMCKGQNNARTKRSLNIDTTTNATNPEDERIKVLVQDALEQLEMSSLHRYKQRVLLVNSYSTKISSRKVTTIDFDVGYTSCLKYEWVENVTSCEFLEHLPRRHCVAQVWEKLWTESGGGKTIEVNCEDDETPLEAHIEFESAENALELAKEALKHIEAKYPHPRRQKVVRIFSLEKQSVAGLHYRLKMEVGLTDCPALSVRGDCKLVNHVGLNKFCRVNVWIRPWTDHPPTYRVACDYQESTTAELYHQIQAESLFSDFLITYKPDYMNDDAQLSKRFEVFKANVRKIHELNIYERGTARYAVTRFSDLSTEEFRARYLGLDLSLRDSNAVPMRTAEIPTLQIPDRFDWREFDAVTEVKDQGSCGSCWAFSVTGNIEGQWKMQSGQLVSLSEQELVDCDKLDNGCNGGLPDNAYRSIEQLGGLELETDYPYEGEDDKCVFNKTLSRVQISGAVNISTNETEMAKWLVHNGPISIGINANAMQFYVGGVSHPWKMLCNPKNLDHGVLIVGYGVKDYPLFHKHLPYWIVKNSWGKSWGEQGYYRVYRGDGTCGVNTMASSAVV